VFAGQGEGPGDLGEREGLACRAARAGQLQDLPGVAEVGAA